MEGASKCRTLYFVAWHTTLSLATILHFIQTSRVTLNVVNL